MRYVSTRGAAPALGFSDVLLTGLAADGGLYVPEAWPTLRSEVWSEVRPYDAVAVDVMWPYVEGSIDRDEFAAMVTDAYAAFEHPDVCPLVELGDLHLLELFWGPTLAFKDVALQIVGRLFDHELTARSERATIVVATSGDTGSAAIEACVGRATLDIVVLHPAGRVSDVQRRQMTTVQAPNVHNVAVEGTFDDCQDLVKALFADVAFREKVRLSAMNSINWARVMAQVVYYVTTVARLGRCSFAVPSGNFGNIFSGLDRRADGAADRPARDRLEQQRHPHPLGRRRLARRRAGGAHLQPVDGHPGVVQPRAAAVRAVRDGTARAPPSSSPASAASARWRRRTTTASRRPASTTRRRWR